MLNTCEYSYYLLQQQYFNDIIYNRCDKYNNKGYITSNIQFIIHLT